MKREKDTAVLYVHGKGGSAAEAEHYRPLFPQADVYGFDYRAETPWDAKDEFAAEAAGLRAAYPRLLLVANSIGAYFFHERGACGNGGEGMADFADCEHGVAHPR